MAASGEGRRDGHFAMREVALFLHALRLSVKAQRIRRQAIGDVVARLVGTRLLPHRVSPGEANRAARRACLRVGRWAGGLNSCLTRSLVAGALLADRDDVALHVGFRQAKPAPPHEGHAWVTLAGRNVTDGEGGDHEPPFAELLTFPLRRAERA